MGSRPPPPVYSGSLEKLRHATITPPGEVTHTPGDIDVGFILINLQRTESLDLRTSASKSSIRRFVITEKAPTRAFSWLKAATTAFTFKDTMLNRR